MKRSFYDLAWNSSVAVTLEVALLIGCFFAIQIPSDSPTPTPLWANVSVLSQAPGLVVGALLVAKFGDVAIAFAIPICFGVQVALLSLLIWGSRSLWRRARSRKA